MGTAEGPQAQQSRELLDVFQVSQASWRTHCTNTHHLQETLSWPLMQPRWHWGTQLCSPLTGGRSREGQESILFSRLFPH